MHIAYVVQRFPNLSETFVAREVLGLRALGHEIDVFSFRRPARRELALMDSGWRRLARSVRYVGRGALVRGMIRGLFGEGGQAGLNGRLQQHETVRTDQRARLGRAYAIASEVARRNVSHVHAHWPYGSKVASLVHEITGIPYSVSVHAHEVVHDAGHFPVLFETLAFAVFCNRAAMEILLGRLPGGCRERSHLVYHGVDLAAFALAPLPAPHSPLRLVSAGRLVRTKGFGRLIAGCAEAARSGLNVELTLLGDGPLRGELQRQARELGFAARLDMPGWVPYARVRDYLVRAHVFLLLAEATYHDGLPNVILEAMACGRPVVVSPLPAISELVADGQEGFVLDGADDVKGLVEVLQALARGPEKMIEMGRAARRRVVRHHDGRVQVRRLADLFEALRPAGD